MFKLRYSETGDGDDHGRAAPTMRPGPDQGRSCKRFSRLGTLSAGEAAISAKVPLGRRVGGKRLRPGRYRATAIAKDLAGNRSKPKRLAFVVTRRRR